MSIYNLVAQTVQQHSEIIHSIAAGLLKLNVNPGDRVAVFSGNIPENIFCYLACFRIGAVVASIDGFYMAEAFNTDVNKITAKILIARECATSTPRRSTGLCGRRLRRIHFRRKSHCLYQRSQRPSAHRKRITGPH